MAYNQKFRFGEDVNGSPLYFYSTNIEAKQVPGTLKQIVGYKVIEREVPMRNILDWNMKIAGVMQDTKANIDLFKSNMNQLQGGINIYEDGNGSHSGSYVLRPYSFKVDEPADMYEAGHITFSFDLIQFQQEQ